MLDIQGKTPADGLARALGSDLLGFILSVAHILLLGFKRNLIRIGPVGFKGTMTHIV